MDIVYVKISDLKPAEYNPRQLTKKQFTDIESSLKEFGFVDPVIVNKHKGRENIIIGGHQRIKVWAKLGKDTVPTHYVSLPKDKESELNIRLNKNMGEWDWDKLDEEFEFNDLQKWGFEEDALVQGLDKLDEDFSNKNKEINPDDLSDKSQLVLKFDNEIYLDILDRLNAIKDDNGESNEDIFLKMLKHYESNI